MVGKAGNMDQIPALTNALLVAEHEVELALEHESELLLVWVHVERRALLDRVGALFGLHEFAARGPHELLRGLRAWVLVHLGNFIKMLFLLPPFVELVRISQYSTTDGMSRHVLAARRTCHGFIQFFLSFF